jgi:hypothetical protein
MSAVISQPDPGEKSAYTSPALTVYGDILELTNILIVGKVTDTFLTPT